MRGDRKKLLRHGASGNSSRASLRDRLEQLRADTIEASRSALIDTEVQRAMLRAGYCLGIALAVIAAFSVHEALQALR